MVMRLVKGNTAVAIGALYAGCDCYFGYPITPASEILQEASIYFPQAGRRFVQAESEVAAINMVYGAAATGRRVLTASSGPGISLKQEGVSYLAGSELPAVIVDIVRAGPGLGNIGPEQGDYNQVVKGGGHGNYRCIVLTPNSVQEMCDLTMRAFDLAFKYRNPVYVLADGVLGQMYEPLRFPERVVTPAIDSSWAVSGTAETRSNLISSILLDSISGGLTKKLQENSPASRRMSRILPATLEMPRCSVSYGISTASPHAVEIAAPRESARAVGRAHCSLSKNKLKELACQAGIRFISVK